MFRGQVSPQYERVEASDRPEWKEVSEDALKPPVRQCILAFRTGLIRECIFAFANDPMPSRMCSLTPKCLPHRAVKLAFKGHEPTTPPGGHPRVAHPIREWTDPGLHIDHRPGPRRLKLPIPQTPPF